MYTTYPKIILDIDAVSSFANLVFHNVHVSIFSCLKQGNFLIDAKSNINLKQY